MKQIKIKYLTFGLKKKTGKNFSGKQVVFSKGGGRKKRRYRIIDFNRLIYKIPYILLRIDYDPNRSSFIGLICYKNGFLSYIILVHGLKRGEYFDQKRLKLGGNLELKKLSSGTYLSLLELRPLEGAKLARSAGTSCILINNIIYQDKKMLVRLPSGEERLINYECRSTLGIISNKNKKLEKKKKAGNNFNLGKKPTVRGVAMNCVDHPNGGGRGKTSKWSDCPNFTRRVLKFVKTVKKTNNNIKKKC